MGSLRYSRWPPRSLPLSTAAASSIREQPGDHLERNRRQSDREEGFDAGVFTMLGTVGCDVAHALRARDDPAVQCRMPVVRPVRQNGLEILPSGRRPHAFLHETDGLAGLHDRSVEISPVRSVPRTPKCRKARPIATRVDEAVGDLQQVDLLSRERA